MLNVSFATVARTQAVRVISQLHASRKFIPEFINHNQQVVANPYQQFLRAKMHVRAVPCLSDNYAYVVAARDGSAILVVDPVEPERVLDAIAAVGGDAARKGDISALIATHRHSDHSGGNEEFVSLTNARLPVIAGRGGDVPAVSRRVVHGDVLTFGSLKVTALSTPCHTRESTCFLVEDTSSGRKGEDDKLTISELATNETRDRIVKTVGDIHTAVFTGDTLFVGGCGRFFEGTAKEMHTALVEVLGSLPLSTRVFCGHEYTLANLKFATSVEPKNDAINEKIEWASKQKQTIPSTIGDELATNPFMRLNSSEIRKHVKNAPPENDTSIDAQVAVMDQLRTMKNNFR